MGCIIACPKRVKKVLKPASKPLRRRYNCMISLLKASFHDIKKYKLLTIPEASSKEEESQFDI